MGRRVSRRTLHAICWASPLESPFPLPCTHQEAELESLLFGRDEQALEQLGQEAVDDDEAHGSALAAFLRSYAAGAAAADEDQIMDERDEEEGRRQRQHGGGGLLLYEDRRGANKVPPASARQQRKRPAWEDPQDAHLRVNVAARNQLRKLRQAEDEVELTGGGQCRHRGSPVCPGAALVHMLPLPDPNACSMSLLGRPKPAPPRGPMPPALRNSCWGAGQKYEQRLRQQHNKLNPRTAWASVKKASKQRQRAAEHGDAGSDTEDEAAEAAERLLQRAGGLLARGAALPPSMLETTRLKDANQTEPCKGAVKCVPLDGPPWLLPLPQRLLLLLSVAPESKVAQAACCSS